MNTPRDPRQRAIELALQARCVALPPSERAWLRRYLEERPEVAEEIRAGDALLDQLRGARLSASPALRARIARRLEGLAAAEEARPAAGSLLGRLRPALHLLLGRDRYPGAPSLGTLLAARSLAVYLGVAVAFCIWLSLRPAPREVVRDPSPSSARIERFLPRVPEAGAPDTRPVEGR